MQVVIVFLYIISLTLNVTITCTEKYDNRLNFVKVMLKNTSGCMLCNFNKFLFPNSQGSVAIQLRFGGKYYLCSLNENFVRFPAVTNCDNLLRYD